MHLGVEKTLKGAKSKDSQWNPLAYPWVGQFWINMYPKILEEFSGDKLSPKISFPLNLAVQDLKQEFLVKHKNFQLISSKYFN